MFKMLLRGKTQIDSNYFMNLIQMDFLIEHTKFAA